MADGGRISVAPATAGRWADFEKLMGKRGGAGGCWCMLWRLSRRDFEAGKGAGNCEAMKAIFESGDPPGLIAYDGGEPIGWCSIAPRAELPRLKASRVLKPLDDQPVWSQDGDRIAFVSYLDGDGEIFTMNTKGEDQVRITNNSSEDTNPTW